MAKVYQMKDYLASVVTNSQNGANDSGESCSETRAPSVHQQGVCPPLRMPGHLQPFPSGSTSVGLGIYYIDRMLIYLATALYLLIVLAQLWMLG